MIAKLRIRSGGKSESLNGSDNLSGAALFLEDDERCRLPSVLILTLPLTRFALRRCESDPRRAVFSTKEKRL